MDKNSKKVFQIFLGAIGIIIAIFALSVFLIIAGEQNKNSFFHKSSTQMDKRLFVYSISGKIKSVKGGTIFLEVNTTDSLDKTLEKGKTEIRKLTIDGKTKIFKLKFLPKKEGVKTPENPTVDSFASLSNFKPELLTAELKDVEINNYISAEYDANLAEFKDFTPTVITILPYSI